MRTSAGGSKFEQFDRDKWTKKTDLPSGGSRWVCDNCGKIMCIIPNPAPNTEGGVKPLRRHQTYCHR